MGRVYEVIYRVSTAHLEVLLREAAGGPVHNAGQRELAVAVATFFTVLGLQTN